MHYTSTSKFIPFHFVCTCTTFPPSCRYIVLLAPGTLDRESGSISGRQLSRWSRVPSSERGVVRVFGFISRMADENKTVNSSILERYMNSTLWVRSEYSRRTKSSCRFPLRKCSCSARCSRSSIRSCSPCWLIDWLIDWLFRRGSK